MKKTIVVILLLLLTSVWSIVFVGASTVQHLGVLPPSNKTLCSPTVLPIGGYNLVLEADTTTTFMLEYFNLQQCFPMQMAITLLQPSQPTIIRDTICAGETYTWNGNTYTKPGSYTDTLQNIYGCDSIVTLHLHVLPDPPLTFTVNGVSFKMMRVRAGSFIMGALDDDTEAEANERPAHPVTLSRDYFVSETVLTQELWTAVMGTTIQEEEKKRTSGNETNLGYGPNFPMYCLSHKDCQKFVERLNQLTGLTFRMPTEAEWEYAARGGHLSRGYKYPGSNNPLEVAWSIANDPQKKLHPVKLLKPNELGLYDMAGNVWEYIYDCQRTYTTAAQIDPLGDTITNKANIRGGSTAWGTTCSRTSYRHQQSNITKDSKDGRRAFRFVLDADRVIGEDNTTYQAYDTICAGDTYTWNGNTYTKPGSYTDTLQNIHGCDSIVTLHLHVLPDPPLTFTVNGVSFKMMRVRAGTFMMGATDDDTEAEAHEKPAHQVILTRDYFIGETMLTQELWTAVMGTTIQEEEEKSSGDKGLGYGANFPMYCISYYDCLNFVERLNQLTGLTFRMPTEAEWEYAARGGHLSRGYKYPGSNDANEVAWNSSKDPENKLHVVKLLLPNELGLYDMAGNTWEWVYDYNRPYTEQSQIDPIGDTLSINAFIRGGSSYYQANHNRVSDRGISFSKAYKRNRIAFRFVLDADRVIGEDNTTYQAYDTICAGETYTWNGNTYTKPGSYTDTLQNIYGCDSIVTLHLHVNPTYEIHDTIVACDSYLYNPFSKNGGGITLYESGTYRDTTTSISGCDSVFVLHLTINQSEIGTTEYATICHGETYTWNGNVYDTSDTYTLTLSNQQGCDSTATLVLTVLPKSVTQTENAIIGSDKLPYLWRGQSLNATGQYTDTSYYAAAHCDSVIHVLNLTVLATGATDEQTATICDTELPYQWYNQAYTATGQYTYTEKYAGTNIDSIQHILNLTINYRDTAFFAETACDSYEWHGKEYNESGTYYYYTQTMLGCDSVEVIRLTILPPTKYLSFDTLLCHGVTCEWRNKQYTTAGTYNDTVRNMLLCDSIIYTLNLQYLPDVVYVEEDTLLCHGVTCEWRNKQYTTAGTYNDTVRNMLLCDSIIYTLNLQYLPDVVYVEEDTLLCHGVTCEWRNKQYTTAGSYNDTVRNMLLCDSIIYTLNLQYLPDVVYVEEDTLLCHGVTCEWRNKLYTTAGTYNDTVRNMLLCDSIIYTLNLQYLPDVVYVEEDTLLCHGVTCEWRNKLYTTAGTYSDTVKNQLQCDSIIYTIELSYLPEVQHFVTDTAICYGFSCTWRDDIYAVSGTYHDTIRNTLHCDSIIYTLNLLIHPEIPITHVTDTMAGPEYHWNEQIYTTGGEYSVILPAVTGCDSTVVLHLLSNPAVIDTVILYEQCAGSGEQEIEILTQGFISQIAFRYSPKALAAGWQDTIMPFSSNNLYTLSYRDMRAGIYEATAVGLFHDVEVATYSFTLTYLYPTTIFEQRYNDLITVLTHDYNGGYDFVAFQWYKDGVLIPGATHSYLNQSLGFEAEYSVLLTDTNGLALISCPIIAEDKAELSVYPTILQPGGSAEVSITESNVLYIHDSTGKIIQEHHLEQGITDISMPIVSGVYLLRFVSNDHIERTFKLIVQ